MKNENEGRYVTKHAGEYLNVLPVYLFLLIRRDGKSYKRYTRCWCKEFPTGVKILVKSVIKGGVKN